MFLEYIHMQEENKIPSAIALGDHIYVSAQLPFDEKGKIVGETIQEQTRKCLENINAVLAKKDLDLSFALKLSIQLTDMDLYDEMICVLSDSFDTYTPAITCMGAASLPHHALIQMDAYALDTRTLRMLCECEEEEEDCCDGNVCTCRKDV